MIANKRGQEMTIGTLILIVLGVVVLVLLIVGFTVGTDFFFDLFKRPSNLEIIAQGCNLAGQGNLKIQYCQEFEEVTIVGTDQYINCEFGDLQASIENKLTCDGGEAKTFCERLDDADATVNGDKCSTLTGTVVPSGNDSGNSS